MKLLPKLILPVFGLALAANLVTLDLTARGHVDAGITTPGEAPSTDSLYKQKCSKCHGADGSGDTSMGRIFNAPDFTDGGWWEKHSSPAERVSVITKGKKNMPAFGKKLTRPQISALASYVQHFKR